MNANEEMVKRESKHVAMNAAMNPRNGMQVWINQAIETAVEDAYKAFLESDQVYYYYIACRARARGAKTCSEVINPHPLVWHGKGLIPFIRFCIHRAPEAFCIMATSSPTKSGIRDQDYDYDRRVYLPTNTICIGDTWPDGRTLGDGNHMIIELWDRVRDNVTARGKYKGQLSYQANSAW